MVKRGPRHRAQRQKKEQNQQSGTRSRIRGLERGGERKDSNSKGESIRVQKRENNEREQRKREQRTSTKREKAKQTAKTNNQTHRNESTRESQPARGLGDEREALNQVKKTRSKKSSRKEARGQNYQDDQQIQKER